MKTDRELRQILREIDPKSYPAYKSLTGAWRFPSYVLIVDHVQGDPFASPSLLHVELDTKDAGFPAEYRKTDAGRIALEDFLLRTAAKAFERYNGRASGSGKSGLLVLTKPGQEVLRRSACEWNKDKLILRFFVGFPAFGRSVNASDLEKILFSYLPSCIREALFYENVNKEALREAVWLAEDQDYLRKEMKKRGIISFLANGSILPRKSGISSLPMQDAIAFHAPASMELSFMLPHQGEIKGMGIAAGITLIVGGGYHGKSTLLQAIQNGVYNHIRGDGREFVLTDDTAVKLRAEDGRSVTKVDISMFIRNLPNGKDTECFSTKDASGSSSQAAAVTEAIEAGARVLLMDEDSSAANFMVRDDFMQQVIKRDKEPIIPFLERVRDLWEQAGISTILVAGSSGAFFHVADQVLMLDCYKTLDIKRQVEALCRSNPLKMNDSTAFKLPSDRRILPAWKRREEKRKNYRGTGLQTVKREHMKLRTQGREEFSLDHETINIRSLEQLVDNEQTLMLAHLVRYILEEKLDGRTALCEIVNETMKILEQEGLAAFCGKTIPCGLTAVRVQELYACINRFRW